MHRHTPFPFSIFVALLIGLVICQEFDLHPELRVHRQVFDTPGLPENKKVSNFIHCDGACLFGSLYFLENKIATAHGTNKTRAEVVQYIRDHGEWFASLVDDGDVAAFCDHMSNPHVFGEEAPIVAYSRMKGQIVTVYVKLDNGRYLVQRYIPQDLKGIAGDIHLANQHYEVILDDFSINQEDRNVAHTNAVARHGLMTIFGIAFVAFALL